MFQTFSVFDYIEDQVRFQGEVTRKDVHGVIHHRYNPMMVS